MSAQRMDQHYLDHVAAAEALEEELEAMHGDDSPTGRDRRRTVAAEVLAVEAHLQRELAEAAALAIGHRVT